MQMKTPNKSILVLVVLLIAGLLHTLPLWNWRENVAGGYGDPLSHATIAQWYCGNVLTGNHHSDQFLAPFGADMSGTYESPFPFILTCPFVDSGTIFQFHIFTLLQIWLIILAGWLVATLITQNPVRQAAYVLFVWWCGFYIARTHQHMTLLSMIWGTQFVFYAIMSLDLRKLKSVLGASFLIGLSYTGTFQNIPTLFLFTFVLVALKLYEERKSLKDLKVLRNLGLGVLVMFGVFLALWWPMIAYTLKNGAVLADADRRLYSLDLLSFLIPYDTNLLYEWLPSLTKFPLERQNSFDLLIFAIAVFSMFKRQFWKDTRRVVLLVLAVIYFVLSLGPELNINNELITYLDFNSELFRTFPLRITRTPGRLALITNVCLIFFAFVFIEQTKETRWKKYLSYFLVGWAVLMGPLMNRMWFFPTLEYQKILNMAALTEVRNMPDDTIVVQIPTAWAQDPSQNFQQIFHGKRITSGYLAYTNYNATVIDNFSREPFLGKLGCDGTPTAFEPTGVFLEAETLRMYLKTHHYDVMIINKLALVNNPACGKLTGWLQSLVKQPWIKSLGENNLYLIVAVL